MSIRKQMILYFSGLIIVIFMLAEVINGWQAYRLLEENITSSIKEGLNLGVKNIEYYFQDAANVCSSIMADERTQNILECEITEDLDGKILGRELNKVVSQYASTRPYITKVYLLDKNNHIITPELQGEELGNFLIQEKNGSLFNISSLHRAGYLMGNVEVFSLVKTIYAYNDRTRRIGTIVADIDSRIVEEATGDYVLPLKGSLLLCDYQGNILAEIEDRKISWTKQAINNNTPKEEFVNIGRESLVTGWTLAPRFHVVNF